MLLGYTDYDIATEERLISAMLMRRPEGVIVTGGSHTLAARKMPEAAGVPVVETWDLLADPIEHSVGFSNAEATASLVRQLHTQGYRRMAFMCGEQGRDARGAERRRGFKEAKRELNLRDGRVITVAQTPVSVAHGAQAVTQLVEQWPEVQALVCESDHAAFGALME